MRSSVPRRRTLAAPVAVIVGVCSHACGGSTPQQVVVDDPTGTSFDIEGAWSTPGALPERLTGSMAALWQDRVYVLGGIAGAESGGATRHFVSFDTTTFQRTALADYPDPVAEGALVVYRDTLLAIGGRSGTQADPTLLLSVNWYDAPNDSWEHWALLPERRYRHTAHAVGDRLYVLGGHGFSLPPGDSIVVFDGREPAYGPPPNVAHTDPMVGGLIGDTVYALTSLFDSRMLRFDGASATWLEWFGNPLEGTATGGVLDGRLHTLGHWLSDEHRVWSPAEGSWFTAPTPPTPVEHAAMVGLNGRLWIIGGHERGGEAISRIQVFSLGG